MKEMRRGIVCFCNGLWLMGALPVFAAAAEMGEAAYTGHTGNLEWIALVFSSLWALILHFLRISK